MTLTPIWCLTLKDDLDLDPSPLKMCSSMRYTCISNIKLLASILQKWHYMSNFDPYIWPWRMTLTFYHSKCAAPWDTHACQISSCYLQYCKSTHKMSDFGHIYLTSDLEGWPWPFTNQNVQLHEMHLHAKYQVAIFNIAKVIANVKVDANQQTNQPTDQQTGQKQYVPHYYSGGHKKRGIILLNKWPVKSPNNPKHMFIFN